MGWPLILLGIGVAIAIGIGVVNYINDQGESHSAVTESFKVAGIVLCQELHGNNSVAWAKCINEVMAEWARATSTRSSFDTSNVPSIPAGSWP